MAVPKWLPFHDSDGLTEQQHLLQRLRYRQLDAPTASDPDAKRLESTDEFVARTNAYLLVLGSLMQARARAGGPRAPV